MKLLNYGNRTVVLKDQEWEALRLVRHQSHPHGGGEGYALIRHLCALGLARLDGMESFAITGEGENFIRVVEVSGWDGEIPEPEPVKESLDV